MTELGSNEFWERLQNEPARLAAEVCFVDVVNIELTLQKQPGLRAWVNSQHEVARIAEERAKWELTKARASAYISSTGTVADRQAAVEMTASVVAAQEAVFIAQEKRGALRAMADALEDRLQMLIQIAAKQRQESRDYSR